MLLRAALLPRLRRWRRLLRRHRRGATASLILLSVLFTLESLTPPSPRLVAVLVAAHDLAGGRVLTRSDLRVARLPPDDPPLDSLDDVTQAEGRVLAAPVRQGEPLTDVRLVGSPLVDALGPGLVAAPVRVADAAAVALVRPGDRVDLLAAPVDATGGAASVVGAGVRVLTVPANPSDTASEGALVVVAVPRRVALALAAAGGWQRLSLSLLPG